MYPRINLRNVFILPQFVFRRLLQIYPTTCSRHILHTYTYFCISLICRHFTIFLRCPKNLQYVGIIDRHLRVFPMYSTSFKQLYGCHFLTNFPELSALITITIIVCLTFKNSKLYLNREKLKTRNKEIYEDYDEKPQNSFRLWDNTCSKISFRWNI